MHFLKSCAVFFLKSFAFSIIFLVCVGVNSDISNGIKTAVENTAPPSVAIDAQAEYQRQLRQSAASLQKNEDYVRRMEQLMPIVESNAKRQAAVLDVLEKQAGIKK